MAGYLFRLFVKDETSVHSYSISDELTPRSRGLAVACSSVDSVPISAWAWDSKVVRYRYNFRHRLVFVPPWQRLPSRCCSHRVTHNVTSKALPVDAQDNMNMQENSLAGKLK